VWSCSAAEHKIACAGPQKLAISASSESRYARFAKIPHWQRAISPAIVMATANRLAPA
jgi:hypothetical protein